MFRYLIIIMNILYSCYTYSSLCMPLYCSYENFFMFNSCDKNYKPKFNLIDYKNKNFEMKELKIPDNFFSKSLKNIKNVDFVVYCLNNQILAGLKSNSNLKSISYGIKDGSIRLVPSKIRTKTRLNLDVVDYKAEDLRKRPKNLIHRPSSLIGGPIKATDNNIILSKDNYFSYILSFELKEEIKENLTVGINSTNLIRKNIKTSKELKLILHKWKSYQEHGCGE